MIKIKTRIFPLLTPGPVTISKKVSQTLSKPVLFHRTDKFCALYSRVCSKLATVFGASSAHQILILSGSGTLGNEAALSSIFGPKDKILVLSNGDFGERLMKILEVHNIEYTSIRQPWATAFDLKIIRKKINDPELTAVAMVAMETSTGMVNPIKEISKMCKTTGRIFFVDAISALGVEDLDVTRDGIDICTSVPNKGLEGPPGLALVCIRQSILDRCKNLPPKSIYMDLLCYSKYASKNQAPTTPAVSLFMALEAALDELISEGLAVRQKRYRKFSEFVRKESANLGIDLLITNRLHSSNAVTTLCFPAQVKVAELHRYLLDHKVTTWHPSHPGTLASKNILQVSVMGDVHQRDVKYFFKLLRAYFDKKHYKFKKKK